MRPRISPNSKSTRCQAGLHPLPAGVDNALFFWLFQAENPFYENNLIIWFNGGPGCSSLIGLTTGNGPISFELTQIHILGPNSDIEPSPAVDNDVVISHFYAWLQSFFAHFPHLRSKQVHLMGESWAGLYIPYFATATVDNQDLFPINLRSMAIGDGSIGNGAAMAFAAIASAAIGKFLASHQSLPQIPDDIMAVFKEASETCGFDDILDQAAQFPPEGSIHIPSRHKRLERTPRDLGDIYAGICPTCLRTAEEVRSSIHTSCYGPCSTFFTAMSYLGTIYTRSFDVNDITHNSSTINSFGLRPNPTTPAHSILPNLVTSHKISLHVYLGEYDMLANHYGMELALQNMTWNGALGFSSPLTASFYPDNAVSHSRGNTSSTSSIRDDNNNNNPRQSHPAPTEAGKWASERGVTYHLFRGAGHSVFLSKPREMFAYVRDVVVALPRKDLLKE
ncbi:Alpha/Beta hydrolase protein [Aspergillus varians]